MSTAQRPRRLSRAELKAQTRRRVIEAARTVFARRGFHGARLEEIAEEAGYSTGAIYSNFEGKEDLFLAVLDEHIEQREQALDDAVRGAPTPAARARAGADNWMRFRRENPDWFPLFIEFWAYAQRDEELRERLGARIDQFIDSNAARIAAGAAELGLDLPAERAHDLGTLVTALADGLALVGTVRPEAVRDDLFGNVLAVLFSLPPDTDAPDR